MTQLICALCGEPIRDDDDSTGDETSSYHYRCWDGSFPGAEDTDETETP